MSTYILFSIIFKIVYINNYKTTTSTYWDYELKKIKRSEYYRVFSKEFSLFKIQGQFLIYVTGLNFLFLLSFKNWVDLFCF